VTGNGFAAKSAVIARPGIGELTSAVTTVTGSFTASLNVPSAIAPSDYWLIATDADSHSASGTFTVVIDRS
jgi:hypothetical protein